MESKGSKPLLQGLVKNCLSPEVLELRKEAMVMCTKNNFEAGYVNGTLGRVIDFDREDGFPIIETSDGRTIKMVSQSWIIEEDGKIKAENSAGATSPRVGDYRAQESGHVTRCSGD
jgi:hypothetical protein